MVFGSVSNWIQTGCARFGSQPPTMYWKSRPTVSLLIVGGTMNHWTLELGSVVTSPVIVLVASTMMLKEALCGTVSL